MESRRYRSGLGRVTSATQRTSRKSQRSRDRNVWQCECGGDDRNLLGGRNLRKVTITWTKVSGPGTVTFANPNVASTTATFSAAGTYVLKLTGNDSLLSTSSTVTVTVK